MVRGGKREEGSGWGTRVYLWQNHVDIWQNQYNIVKLKNKEKKRSFKLKKKNFPARLINATDKCYLQKLSLDSITSSKLKVQFSSVQLLSRVRPFVTP